MLGLAVEKPDSPTFGALWARVLQGNVLDLLGGREGFFNSSLVPSIHLEIQWCTRSQGLGFPSHKVYGPSVGSESILSCRGPRAVRRLAFRRLSFSELWFQVGCFVVSSSCIVWQLFRGLEGSVSGLVGLDRSCCCKLWSISCMLRTVLHLFHVGSNLTWHCLP